MIIDENVGMSVQSRLPSSHLSESESRHEKDLIGIGIPITLRRGQSINQPIDIELLPDPPIDKLRILGRERDLVTNRFASLILQHMQVEDRCHNAVAEKNASQRLVGRGGSAFGFAEVEGIKIVAERKGGAEVCLSRIRGGRESVGVEWDMVALLVCRWREAGEVEG